MRVSDATYNKRCSQVYRLKAKDPSVLYSIAESASGAAWKGTIRRARSRRKKDMQRARRSFHKEYANYKDKTLQEVCAEVGMNWRKVLVEAAFARKTYERLKGI